MRYVYIIHMTDVKTNKEIDIDYEAFTNFTECKQYVEKCQTLKLRRANDVVDKDEEIKYNDKFDLLSSYQWNETGEYSRSELEEMKFKNKIIGYAEMKVKMYNKWGNKYFFEPYYIRIDRYRIR